MIAAPTRTVPAGTSRLAFGIHAGTIDDLPVSSAIGRLTIQERYFTARDAGFVLIQGGDDDVALRAGLERAGMGRVVHAGETARLAEDAKARGFSSAIWPRRPSPRPNDASRRRTEGQLDGSLQPKSYGRSRLTHTTVRIRWYAPSRWARIASAAARESPASTAAPMV